VLCSPAPRHLQGLLTSDIREMLSCCPSFAGHALGAVTGVEGSAKPRNPFIAV